MSHWHAQPVAEVAAALDVDLDRGLSEVEVRARRDRFGRNRLEEGDGGSAWALLARQFASPLVVLLLGAASLASLVGEHADAVAIAAILLLNALFGFAQEWKAERELAQLRRILSPECSVLRDGSSLRIAAEDLVPGDVVQLQEGDRVPADLRVAEVAEARIDESVLTGESLPVAKHPDAVPTDAPLSARGSMLWMGTAVTSGRTVGMVVRTGMDTEFGRVARMSGQIDREPTPLQRRLARLARQLGGASLAVAAGVAVLGWAAGRPAWEMTLTAVSLAVAIVPEGLPAVVTLTLALGVRQLVRRRVLLRRLAAAEAIGSATVLCTDKTGTLTENSMRLRRVVLPGNGSGVEPGEPAPGVRELLLSALAASTRRVGAAAPGGAPGGSACRADPTEAAIAAAADEAGVSLEGEVIREVPFDSARRRMTVVVRAGRGTWAHCKGAPEVLIERSVSMLVGDRERALDQGAVERLRAAHEGLAAGGLRVLAVARRRIEGALPGDAEALEDGLCLLGFVGLQDPPRPEVADAVATAQSAGIRLHMVTGDAEGTAAAIAREIGIDVASRFGQAELAKVDDEELGARMAAGSVLFFRATPEDKLRIVRVLKKRGEIVGMTGDGVNDAPALKQADVGIAMGVRGTDVARGAADLVVTDDNFASIVAAVHEGRRQFDNIRQFIGYLLSSNAGEVLALLLNVLTGGPLILLPVQILWVNLLTDGVTALALGAEPAEPGVMRRPPRSPAAAMLERSDALRVLRHGATIGLLTFAAFRMWLATPETAVRAQTMAFTVIILAQVFNVLNYRASRVFDIAGWRANPLMPSALLAAVALHVAAVGWGPLQALLGTVPLTGWEWAWATVLAVPVALLPRPRQVPGAAPEAS